MASWRELAGVFVISDEPITQQIHLPLMPGDEDVERSPIASGAGAHEFFVSGGLRIRIRTLLSTG
jgi:hypothetical protein